MAQCHTVLSPRAVRHTHTHTHTRTHTHRSDGHRDRSIMLLYVALQCKLSYTTSFQTIHTNPASPKASCYSSRLLSLWTHTHTHTHTHRMRSHTHTHTHRLNTDEESHTLHTSDKHILQTNTYTPL